MKSSAVTARFQLGYGSFTLAVDVDLPGSGISVLFGASGSGKTTVLRCLAGLEKPEAGFVSINGTVWQDSKNNHFLPTHKRNLGYVFQEANLFPHLTVSDNLGFGLNRIHAKAKNDSLQHIVALLGINHLLDRLPERLSGGEKQRVAIARALVLNPAILLLDEPLASLDLKRKQEVMPYLLTLQQDFAIPIVYVTHSLQEVMQLADYLIILDNGRVQAAGVLPDMLSRLDLALTHDKDASSVWQGTVTGHEAEFQLSNVTFDGITLALPVIDKPVGSQLRVLIQARDVSLALQAPNQTSILNILPATITTLADDAYGHTVVSLSCGRNALLAHITRKSSQLLGLHEGLSVFAQIKGTSLLL